MMSASAESSPAALAARARRIVLDAGFQRVGFSAARAAPGAEALRRWVDRGFAGGMAYIERSLERRQDPRRVLPGARSAIACAVHYQGAAPPPASVEPGAGRIAAYAQGEDYHRVLEARLRAACATLKLELGGEHRYYVDTGPVLERDWAQLAGLGWIGKNTCLIDRRQGSYSFLAVILTTLELAADMPAENHCGTCRACLDACPTGAFVGPYELDARRCISYLTIEERDVLPPELEPAIGNWVFGCDVCQDVCPFNRESAAAPDPALAPRPENLAPSLEALAALDEQGFRARFPRSAVRRARRAGLVRNALVALGNDPGPDAATALARLASTRETGDYPVLAATLERARRRR